jgi:putative ABC transport system substrate-binding protein
VFKILYADQSNRAGLVNLSRASNTVNRAQIVSLAAQARLRAIYENSFFLDAGGLMSYGANMAEIWRGAAPYVDKILKGAKPGDLPVEQPSTFDLGVNSKTAKTLGLAIPRAILLRADRVIE